MSVLIIVKRFVSIRIECMNYSGLAYKYDTNADWNTLLIFSATMEGI